MEIENSSSATTYTPLVVPIATWRGRELERSPESEARAADEALLVARLRELGVRRPIVVHENRTVMVSVGRANELRIHRGYAYSSDRILKAIINFVNARNRAARLVAEREIQTFAIDSILRPKRRRKRRVSKPRDRELLAELQAMHAHSNATLFGGELSPVTIGISDRMRTRLGEVTLDPQNPRSVEITISRAHWERDGRREVERTLIHEMIHQWQAESGLKVDHGVSFRRKAGEVGVPPSSRRAVDRTSTTAKQA